MMWISPSTPTLRASIARGVAILASVSAAAMVATVAIGGPAPAAGPQPHDQIVTGRVLSNGEPLVHAELDLVDAQAVGAAPAATTTTGRDGRFALRVPAGVWTLEAHAVGHASQRLDLDPATLADSPRELAPVDLLRTRRLTLTVVDPRDQALAGVVGWPVEGLADAAETDWRPIVESIAIDRSGRGTIDIPIGEDLRFVSADPVAGLAPTVATVPDSGDLTLIAASGRPVLVEARYPNGDPAAGARVLDPLTETALVVLDDTGRGSLQLDTPITVRIDDDAGGRGLARLDPQADEPQRLRIEPLRSTAGSVLSAATGEPLSGAQVWGRSIDGRPTWTTTDSDGQFRLAMAASKAEIGAVAPFHDVAWTTERAGRADVHLMPHRFGVGFVHDLDDRPIEGARVGLGRHVATTTADGRFVIANPETGRQDLVIEATGARRLRLPGIDVPAERGEVDFGIVTLARGSRVAGWVVGADGRGVSDAEVIVLTPSDNPVLGEPLAITRTDLAGEFLADGLPPGRVALRVVAEGHRPAVVEARAPDEGLEVVLEATRRLTGRVVGPDGGPVEGALVSLELDPNEASDPIAAALALSAMTDGDGRFVVEGLGDGSGGTVTLVARAAGYGAASRRLQVVGPLDDVEITLSAESSLSGIVRGSDGRPISAHLGLASSDGQEVQGIAVAGADGRFAFRGLSPGRHILVAESAAGQIERAIDLQPGEQHLELAIDSAGVEVYGQVVDATGQGIVGARVVLHGTAAGLANPETTTDAFGQFTFGAVAPGEYSPFAEHPEHAPARDGQRLQVADSAVGGVEIVLGRGGSIHGRVSGVEIDDLSNVVVRALGVSGGVGVDFDGRFRLGPLPAGELVVEATLRGSGRVVRERVFIPADGTAPAIELQLR